MAKSKKPEVIFRPFITTPDGRRIWAKSYGLRAFPIPVKDLEKERDEDSDCRDDD
ncbi:MAG: hypothetical protein AAGA03_14625 [Planctomycetota bacterium]